MLKENIKKIATMFKNVMFPGYSCDCCGEEIKENNLRLCPGCYEELKLHKNSKTCVKCGNIINDEELVCEECKEKHFSFDKAISVCDYSAVSGSLVKQFKFDGKKYVSETIAKMMIVYLNELNIDFDFITCVPISKERFSEREFNQSEILAQKIAKHFEKPFVNLLFKLKDTPKQSTLSQIDRYKNLRGVIKIKVPLNLKGKTIILVDDVFTTGTTLDECSRQLLKLKPKEIIAFTFAKVDYKMRKLIDA